MDLQSNKQIEASEISNRCKIKEKTEQKKAETTRASAQK